MESSPDPPVNGREDSETRAGYVAMVGRPNAGKSSLLNAFLGERLSIVTAKAQTTWRRVTGILTSPGVQMVFLDTPGLLETRDLLQRAMLGAALEALEEADVVLVVLDAARGPEPGLAEQVLEVTRRTDAPLIAAVNKIDVAHADRVEETRRWSEEVLAASAYPVSALRGDGVGELRAAVDAALPEGPFLYPEDQIASDPVRFFVAELVRETVFEQFQEEVPYSTYVVIEEYREAEDPVYIQANVFVERRTQKGILVGQGGRSIRKLGTVAREKIESFIERPVYLDLWVKVLPGWRRRKVDLKRLGFRVPEDHET